MCQFIGGVSGIGRRDDAASPVRSPHQRRDIDGVWREDSEDIALLPLPSGFEALAELQRSGLDLSICVGPQGIRILVDYCKIVGLAGSRDSLELSRAGMRRKPTLVIRKLPVLPLEEKLPQINVWDLNAGIRRVDRHGGSTRRN
jgi:hypothetical protein